MLTYSNAFISEWNKHIIFAGNGVGKTTNANQLKKDLISAGLETELFTRRSIEALIAGKEGRLFFGKAAQAVVRLEQNKEMLKNDPQIKEATMRITGTTSAKKAKEKNFYARKNAISSMNSIPKKHKMPKAVENIVISDDELMKIGNCLSLDLYERCVELKNLKRQDLPKPILAPEEVPSDYEDCLINMIIFIRLTHKKECLLCGKRYRGTKGLLNAADKHFRSLSFVDQEPKDVEIVRLAQSIAVTIPDLGPFSNAFDHEPAKTLFSSLRTIKIYTVICDHYLWKTGEIVNKTRLSNGKTVEEVQKAIEDDLEAVQSEKTKKTSVTRYNSFIKKEVSKILRLEDGYAIEGLKNELGICLTLNGKPTKISIYNFLSESQFKRLCLIALNAEIHYGSVKALILDDPVDSYDDYSKLMACRYIATMLKTANSINWYILTNDHEGLFYLVDFIKCPTIFYLQDFSTAFGGTGGLMKVECSSDDVNNQINKNDIFYLIKYINERPMPNIDSELLTCGLLMTLRNISKEIVNQLTHLIVGNAPARSAPHTYPEDLNWKQNIDDYVVGSAEHHRLSGPLYSIGSDNLTLGQICSCYADLAKGRINPYPSANRTSTILFANYRKTAAAKSFVCVGDWTDIINYLFKKMTAVSFVKYEMERRLYNLCAKSFSSSELDMVVQAKGIKAKISKAKRIDSAQSYGIGPVLNRFMNIHEKYSVMYNAFDHALTYQIAPYLTTSVQDIDGFWSSVKKL